MAGEATDQEGQEACSGEHKGFASRYGRGSHRHIHWLTVYSQDLCASTYVDFAEIDRQGTVGSAVNATRKADADHGCTG